jgi:hypothetical protein
MSARRFTVFWEEFHADIYGTPYLQRESFATLGAAIAFGQSIGGADNFVFGIFLGTDEPIIDKKRRNAWISRRRRHSWRRR